MLPEEAVNFNGGIVEIPFTLVQSAKKHLDKVYDVNVISNGDAMDIFTVAFFGHRYIDRFSPMTRDTSNENN